MQLWLQFTIAQPDFDAFSNNTCYVFWQIFYDNFAKEGYTEEWCVAKMSIKVQILNVYKL